MATPQDLLSPINSKKIYNKIVEQFIELIDRGEFKPGQQLPSERELARHLKVSRASLREAFTVLQLMGLVETISGQGSVICEKKVYPNLPTTGMDGYGESPFLILQARSVIEPAITGIATNQQTAAGVKKLEEILNKVDTDVSPAGAIRDVFSAGDREFHMELARMTENPILIFMQEVIHHQMEQKLWKTLARQTSFSTPGLRDDAEKDHHAVFEAVCARDSKLAVRRMKAHLQRVEKTMAEAELIANMPEEEQE
jgi:GntR family transcriptional repressor for pyruvate dehydrogenase complex